VYFVICNLFLPNSLQNIKYCVWHYKRSLEKQKNILCYHEMKNNNDVYIFIIKLFRTVMNPSIKKTDYNNKKTLQFKQIKLK